MTRTPPHRRELKAALASLRAGRRATAARQVAEVLAGADVDDAVLLVAASIRFVAREHQGALEVLDRVIARRGVGLRRAVAERVGFAGLLGWDQEVRATLEAAMAIEPHEPRWCALATPMFVRAGATEQALRVARRALELEPASARMGIEVARLHAELGHEAEAIATIEAARVHVPAASVMHHLGMAHVLRDAGAFDQARIELEAAWRLEPTRVQTMLDLAEQALWSGDAPTALRWASAAEAVDAAAGGAARVRGVVAMLEGDAARAAPCFDRAVALDPDDAVALCWRAEAAYRMQQHALAHELLTRATMRAEGFLFVAWVLRLLVVLHEPARQILQPRRFEELREAVEEIVPEARAVLEQPSKAPLVRCLELALERMRGNRTPTATFVDEHGTLRRVRSRSGVRHAARHALQLIRVLTPAETLTALDEVVRRHPDSPLPICHRGELRSWLGDVAGARADLEATLRLDPLTRWAYIGLSGLDLLEDDPERALRTSAHGVRTMGHTEGPAVHVHRGEALRRLGRHDEARVDLERAIELSPTRISAWVDLALVHAATGRRDAFDDAWRHLEAAAPGLLSDASRELAVTLWGDPGETPSLDERARVLEHALSMMRGNRSTSCATYFTREQRLRFVQPFSATAKRPHDDDEPTLARAEALLRGRAR